MLYLTALLKSKTYQLLELGCGNKSWNNYESSSSSSTDSSRYSRKKHSSRSGSRHHKKSTRRHRSNSSSEYSSSRHKHSSRSYHKDESRLKRKHHRKSSSTSYDSNNSNSSTKNHQSKSSKPSNDNEKNKRIQPNSTFQDDSLVVKSETVNKKDHDANWLQNNVLDIVKRENSIEQINQEGFVFKVFNPSSEQKYEETTDKTKSDVPKINEEDNDNLPTEESTFFICNPERLLNARYKLLTKQERCINWAKQLFESYNQSERNGGQFAD